MKIEKPYTVKFRLRTFTVHDSGAIDQSEKLSTPGTVETLARTIYADLDADKEHFFLFTVNNKNTLTGFKHISTGSLTASLVHPREVMSAAIELRAAAMIFVHNHPAGEPTPSEEDLLITRRLVESAEMLGIRVLDHIILGSEGRSFSFSEKQML